MNLETFRVICVTNQALCDGDYLERITAVAKLHPYAVILREKGLGESEYVELAKKVMRICGGNGVKCILHTYVEAAVRLGADSIHLPQSVLRMADRDVLSEFRDVGASCHSVEEAAEAERMGCTYITAGHIYATDCKKDLEPRGIGFLGEVCDRVSIPVYAIGGIDRSKFDELIKAGAAGACIMSGFMRGRLQSEIKNTESAI